MIYVLLAEGFEEIEALTPVDMLRRAGYDVRTVGIAKKTVTGAHGISVIADLTAEEASDEDVQMVILPGGMPGTKHLAASPFVEELLKRLSARGAHLAAICAAPTVLAKYGYLDGKRATCFPGFESELAGAVCTDLPVVTDGDVTTAKDMTEALSFSVALLAALDARQQKSAGHRPSEENETTKEDTTAEKRNSVVVPEEYLSDPTFFRILTLTMDTGRISAPLIQRNIGIGYSEVAKYLHIMEELGIIGRTEPGKPYKLLIEEEK